MARIRHLAIASDTPDETAQFYCDALGLRQVREIRAAWGHGHVLTDGTLSISIIRYTDAAAAGTHGASTEPGLHHLGFEADDVDASAGRVASFGAHRRGDIEAALGMAPGGRIGIYTGPDGVLFDLGDASVWGADLDRTSVDTAPAKEQ